jgi:toxin FitB
VEIRAGIAKAAREGARRTADSLKSLCDTVEYLYGDRILPLDLKAATIAGALSDRAAEEGHKPGFADIAIAAIAEAHALIPLTRNTRHSRPIYGRVVNPFETLAK